jgi:hypothetical protein
MNPIFGPFHQLAYVTTDMDRAQRLMRDEMGVPSFLTRETNLNATVGGKSGKMNLIVALANVDGVQVELIQDMGSDFDLYSAYLPKDGDFRPVFHHFCIIVKGTIADWEAHVADLGAQHPPYYVGDVGDRARFCYTDERKRLGHYIEHVWFTPATEERLARTVPRFTTKKLA